MGTALYLHTQRSSLTHPPPAKCLFFGGDKGNATMPVRLAACLNTPDVPSSLQRYAHEDGKYFKIYFFFGGGEGKYIYFCSCVVEYTGKFQGKCI